MTIPIFASGADGAVAGDYSLSASSVTIDSGETSATFTVTATDDTVDDDGESVLLSFGTLPTRVSAGSLNETMVSITDDDSRGIMIIPESLTLIEGGSSHDYTVQLLSQPTAAVTVSVAVEIPPGVSALRPPVRVSPLTLHFNASNWDSPQTVMVSPNYDDDAFDDTAATLKHTASGGGYDDETASLPVIVTDDDTGSGRIDLSVTTLSIQEEKDSFYTVSLASEPVQPCHGADNRPRGNRPQRVSGPL